MNFSKAYKYKIMTGEEQFVWGESASVFKSFLRKLGDSSGKTSSFCRYRRFSISASIGNFACGTAEPIPRVCGWRQDFGCDNPDCCAGQRSNRATRSSFWQYWRASYSAWIKGWLIARAR